MQANILTIDGPSGVGKGTIAKIVAKKLKWHLLDSGAIYRALALKTLKSKTLANEAEKITKFAKQLALSFDTQSLDEGVIAILEGEDVSAELRTQSCAEMASKLASIETVRHALLDRQRQFDTGAGLVADGRDMGSVVFPNAQFKIFLNADAKERAIRRIRQLQMPISKGIISQVLQEIKERDARDYNRKHSPLVAAKDAHIIDTTKLTIAAVVDRVLGIMGV